MNVTLLESIQLARESVLAHEHHVLMPFYRHQILWLFGPTKLGSSPITHEGHRRRTLLAIASAKMVLPKWERMWPEEHEPQQALAMAERLITEKLPFDQAHEVMVACSNLSEQRSASRNVAWRAGMSAAAALSTAMVDELIVRDELTPETPDIQMGGEDADASSLAAIAFAGGFIWDVAANDEQRLLFWNWWLNEAVPAAYSKGTLISS